MFRLTPSAIAGIRDPQPPARDDSAPDRRLQDATDGLWLRHPELSAKTGSWMWQRAAVSSAAAACVCGLLAWLEWFPRLEAAWSVFAAALMMTFACVIAVRCLVLWTISFPHRQVAEDDGRTADDLLPTYTVLVPVYRETGVAGQLMRAMAALDYPSQKLQILFVCEEHDLATQAALRRGGLAENMRLVIVPDGQPRTKPRALNYALSEATGDYVVVYDAEDEPQPSQLRRAVAAFRRGGPRQGCLQAQLKIYNANDTWLTRQFAIEYAALFSLILPAFDRFGLPIPLGGTSNHFPRHVLIDVCGWDPYNVTEDADLGIRLARLGWHVGVLASATWEEAPDTYRVWLLQRIRWQKGWLQTAIVATRQPWRLWRELGALKFIAVLVTLASMLLSAFVHPIYAMALLYTFAGAFAAGESLDGNGWWWSGLGVFVTGYVVSVIVAVVAARRSDHPGLSRHVFAVPAYWMLISVAAYWALYDYYMRPFHWNKTPHTGRHDAAEASRPLGPPVEEVANQL